MGQEQTKAERNPSNHFILQIRAAESQKLSEGPKITQFGGKKRKVRAKLETTQLVFESELELKPPAPAQRNSSGKSLSCDLQNSEARVAEKCALRKALRIKSKACFGASPSGEHVSMSHISRVSKQHPDGREHLGHYLEAFLL